VYIKITVQVLDPKYIYAHRHEEQDVILWYNRALWHSIVSFLTDQVELWSLLTYHLKTEFPKSYGPRGESEHSTPGVKGDSNTQQ
jgi:hypothetical protein